MRRVDLVDSIFRKHVNGAAQGMVGIEGIQYVSAVCVDAHSASFAETSRASLREGMGYTNVKDRDRTCCFTYKFMPTPSQSIAQWNPPSRNILRAGIDLIPQDYCRKRAPERSQFEARKKLLGILDGSSGTSICECCNFGETSFGRRPRTENPSSANALTQDGFSS